MYLTEEICARCSKSLINVRCTGVSSLYFPGSYSILLCEPCYLDEDEMLNESSNKRPDLLERYINNVEPYVAKSVLFKALKILEGIK